MILIQTLLGTDPNGKIDPFRNLKKVALPDSIRKYQETDPAWKIPARNLAQPKRIRNLWVPVPNQKCLSLLTMYRYGQCCGSDPDPAFHFGALTFYTYFGLIM